MEGLKNNKVLLGMSGGTDSSTAAILLQEQGYTVVGITFRFWSDTDETNNKGIPEYLEAAKDLARKLQIEHHAIDLRKEFYDEVVQFTLNGYLNGQTPNPCTKCNPQLKWKKLLEYANKLGCFYLATGHYVQTTKCNNQSYITLGNDPEKEQSFFLWGLSNEILNRTLFPLGAMHKTEVKAYAESKGFKKVANKKESTGICFLKDGKYQPFLEKAIGKNKLPGSGNFIDTEGNILGKHKGFPYYTVGQRRGLGLVPKEPLFVVEINSSENEIVLGGRNDLYKKGLILKDYNLQDETMEGELVEVKIRYRKQKAFGKFKKIENNCLEVLFTEPEWSIAPGQAAAFYHNGRLIGGGIIEKGL